MSEPIVSQPSISLPLYPFTIPNFVIVMTDALPRPVGFQHATSVALKNVDAKVLASMCDDFRALVFRKAGKEDPSLT